MFNISEVRVGAVNHNVFSGVQNGQTAIRDGWLTRSEEPSDHTYIVHPEGEIPSDCTCPAFE